MPHYYTKRIGRMNIMASIAIILLLTVGFMVVFSTSSYHDKAFHNRLVAEQIYNAKKHFIQNAVNRTIGDIETEIARCAEHGDGRVADAGAAALAGQAHFCSEDAIKNRIKERIRNTRLADDGYIWINQVLDYGGGDNYAIRLVHPNLIETEGMLLSTAMTDIKGNTPYLTELEGVKQSGELFFDYWFKKKNSDVIMKKLTFAKLYPPYDWIVATGVYVDDVEHAIVTQEERIAASFSDTLVTFTLLGMVSVLVALSAALFFHRSIRKTIQLYKDQNDEKERTIRQINETLEKKVRERTRQLVASRQKLIESWKKYIDLYDHSPDMYVSVDAGSARIIECNRTLADKLGRTKQDIIGCPVFDLYHPGSLADAKQAFQTFIDTGIVENAELQLMKKDGGKIDVILNVTAVYDENGKVRHSRSAWRDITEHKRIEQEKKQLEAQLRQIQKIESIGTLAGGIAHDFNNILAAIIGYCELALDEAEKGSLLADHLQEVYAAGKRARNIVGQILTYARQTEEENKPIPVGAIVADALQFMRASIPTSIEIRQSIDSHARVMGNRTQLHQIIVNLCTNAAQAMEAGGGTLHVKVRESVVDQRSACQHLNLGPGPYLEIIVSDTGEGIAPDALGSVFDPYFTTKGVGEGSGLGLAVVHGIVESYGGRIVADSVPGTGSTFTIYLPVTRQRPVSRPDEAEPVPAGSENILFVDDEAPIAKMGRQMLERLGYRVTACTSSTEALALFRAKPGDVDLVVSDMTMPDMTGDRLAAEMMAIRPDIPVILCTGYSKKIADRSAAELGIKALVYKPIVKADLAKTVREVLDGANGE